MCIVGMQGMAPYGHPLILYGTPSHLARTCALQVPPNASEMYKELCEWDETAVQGKLKAVYTDYTHQPFFPKANPFATLQDFDANLTDYMDSLPWNRDESGVRHSTNLMVSPYREDHRLWGYDFVKGMLSHPLCALCCKSQGVFICL